MGIRYNRETQKAKRQYLRTHSTKAEIIMWLNLKARQMCGYKFRRQYGVGQYVLDFYCPELRLAIEVDGATHESEEARKHDALRQAEIEKHGIRFLRFTDEQVYGSMDEVVQMIESEIERIRAEP